jgi:hypothetical protein
MTEFTKEDLDDIDVSEEQLARQETAFVRVGAGLRSWSDASEDDRPWAEFYPQVQARIHQMQEEIDFQPEHEVLQSQFEAVIQQRDGQWSAFTQRVLDEAEQSSTLERRRGAQAQALTQMESDIESTLDGIEPDFEHRFYAQLQARLAQPPPSRWQAYMQGIAKWMRPPQWAFGAFAVAMTAMFVWVNTSTPKPRPLSAAPASGQVRVDTIQFEGTVTLSQSEDLTVIWLASASG